MNWQIDVKQIQAAHQIKEEGSPLPLLDHCRFPADPSQSTCPLNSVLKIAKLVYQSK